MLKTQLNMLKIFKNQYFWLTLVLLAGFWVRLYKIDSPIADWHSWRQADTAAVTRNFIKEGFNPFFPKYDDMSAVSESPIIINPNRFRFVEFPIYNIATYPLYLLFGIDDKYSRLVSVLFSLGSIFFLYLICKKYLGVVVSLLTALIYALLPFNIFFSRTTLPEPTFLFFALGMMFFVDKFIWEGKLKWGIWGFIFTATSFLIKPWAVFFTLPLLYSIIAKYRQILKIPKKFLLFGLLALIPFIFWRLWILQQPEGIPASSWLLNGDHIRFRPAFWWWIVSERIGREILGTTGFALFIIGLIVRPKSGNFFLQIWAISMFLYFIIFATGNVRHNYYQYIFVPVVAVFLTQGLVSLIRGMQGFLPRFWTIILALIIFPLAFYFSWVQVKEFYKINNPAMVETGKEANQILPKDAVVLAPYNGDTAFLYQTNRSGWAYVPTSTKELIADYGVSYYVSTSYDDKTNWILRHFYVIKQTPQFVIADLTKIKKDFDDSNDREP